MPTSLNCFAITAFATAMALATPALAERAYCTFADDPWYECEIRVRPHSFEFDLLDGGTLLLHHTGPGVGEVMLLPHNVEDYDDPKTEDYQSVRPWELGEFRPVPGEEGCWQGLRDVDRFCVRLEPW